MSKTTGTLLLSVFLFFVTLHARNIDIDALASDAAKHQKHLLVWLHKTDCGYCESMREFTLEDEKIASVIKASFDFVHININEKDRVTYRKFDGGGHAFAKHVGFNFYPSSLFMDADGTIVFAAPGYVEETDFFRMLQFVRSEAYKTMDYDRFKRTGVKQ